MAITKICQTCKGDFRIIPAKANTAKYCSRKCKDIARTRQGKKYARVHGSCVRCGVFISRSIPIGRNYPLFCSRECSMANEGICLVCASPLPLPASPRRKYCSVACTNKAWATANREKWLQLKRDEYQRHIDKYRAYDSVRNAKRRKGVVFHRVHFDGELKTYVKKCVRCLVIKPISDYSPNSNKSGKYVRAECKQCASEIRRYRNKLSKQTARFNRSCADCGKTFTTSSKTSRYCSPVCRHAYCRKPRKCKVCGIIYPNQGRGDIYCSKACMGEDRKRRVKRICKFCSKPFECKPAMRRKFCSMKCKYRSSHIYRTCEHCKKTYRFISSRNKGPYCSRKCSDEARSVQVLSNCKHCGQEFSHYPSAKRLYCSYDCFRHASPTSIEEEAYFTLSELGISYIAQHRVGRYFIDAYLPSHHIAIEIQGDYWHCNPAKYPAGPKDETQRMNIEKDKRKFKTLSAKGMTVIQLWESDIRMYGAKALLEPLIK